MELQDNDGGEQGTRTRESNLQFQSMEYWDKRYQHEETFDWFKTYDEVKDIINEVIPDKQSRILMLGSGNSTLSGDMFADGYQNITNIDFSAVLIEKMKLKHPEQEWLVMDIRELRERADELGGAESWDVVLDKATLDALMAIGPKESVWDPSPTVRENVAKEIDGVLHLLKPKTGIWLYITFAQKHFRLPLLEREGQWTIETRTIGDAFHYFVYIARKE